MIDPSIRNEWEMLNSLDECYRMKVFGGWLFKTVIVNSHTIALDRGGTTIDNIRTETVTFIPDLKHIWLKKEELKAILTEEV